MPSDLSLLQRSDRSDCVVFCFVSLTLTLMPMHRLSMRTLLKPVLDEFSFLVMRVFDLDVFIGVVLELMSNDVFVSSEMSSLITCCLTKQAT